MAARTTEAQAVDAAMAEFEPAVIAWLDAGGSAELVLGWLDARLRFDRRLAVARDRGKYRVRKLRAADTLETCDVLP